MAGVARVLLSVASLLLVTSVRDSSASNDNVRRPVGISVPVVQNDQLEAHVSTSVFSFKTSARSELRADSVLIPKRNLRKKKSIEIVQHIEGANRRQRGFSDERYLESEEGTFWERFLQQGSTSLVIPTPAPTPTPSECPVRVKVSCMSSSGVECKSLPPLGPGECHPGQVVYTYNVTNYGTEIERVYTMEVTRNDEARDVLDSFDPPFFNLQPGESVIISDTVDSICEGQNFDTKVHVMTGPPCNVEIETFCFSDGVDCRSIPPAQTVEDCPVVIEWVYVVSNTGVVNTTIIELMRERSGETRDLMPLLDNTLLPVDDTKVVQEMQDINICQGGTFSTFTRVRVLPPADTSCEDEVQY